MTEMREFRSSLDGESLRPAKLSFGDYVRILQKPERWKKVRLLVDQAILVGKLEESQKHPRQSDAF